MEITDPGMFRCECLDCMTLYHVTIAHSLMFQTLSTQTMAVETCCMYISWVKMQTMEAGTISLGMIWAQVLNTLSKLHPLIVIVILTFHTIRNHFHLPDHLDIVATHFQYCNFQRDGVG